MKLYLIGHDYKYAAEQMMLTLFPGQRPQYSDAPPAPDEPAVTLCLSMGRRWATATVTLSGMGDGVHRRTARAPLPAADADTVVRDRTFQHILKTAFYRAGTDALGHPLPWGALTGVRPVKLPTRVLTQGGTRQEADRHLRDVYHVSPARRRLALDCAEACVAAQALLQPDEVSLYIGIPFCPSRCAYCSFISADAGKSLHLMAPYFDALRQELAATAHALHAAGKQVKTFYMGGGTPTTLSAQQLDCLLGDLWAAMPMQRCTELTVEAGRPDTITQEKLAVLRRHRVERISLNPQSMEEHVLRAIGRAHSAGDIHAAWPLVRQAGFSAVNMDLIAGLPADTQDGFRRSLDQVLALDPENITVHTLALKKGSALLSGGANAALPTPQAVSAMLEYAWDTLRSAGYLPYYLYRQKYMSGGFENVGWAKPGCESLYNIYMMEELHTIVSLGAGGVTKCIDTAAGSLVRLANPKYPKEYIDRIADIATQKQALV